MNNYIIFCCIVLFNCNEFEDKKNTRCDYKNVKFTLAINIKTEMLRLEDHTVFVDGLDPLCNDSLQIVRIADDYIKSYKSDYKLRSFTLVTDTSAIMPGETLSQNWPEINKSAIVGFLLDDNSNIIEFTFYGEYGKSCYRGPNWRPCRK